VGYLSSPGHGENPLPALAKNMPFLTYIPMPWERKRFFKTSASGEADLAGGRAPKKMHRGHAALKKCAGGTFLASVGSGLAPRPGENKRIAKGEP